MAGGRACARDLPSLRRGRDAGRGEEDRFFQVEFRGQTLWAANRDHALALIEFIEGSDRRRLPDDVTRAWARRIPTHFLTAKGRETIVKRLRRLIEEYEA